MTSPKRIKLIFAWSAVGAVAVLIFFFSSQTAQESTQVSHGLIEQIYLWYTSLLGRPCASGDLLRIAAFWDHFVRKLAHFSIYALLGLCCANAFSLTLPRLKKAFVLSFLAGSLYAVTDEIHQRFVPGRSCQLTDMALDSCGVAFGIFLFCILYFIFTKKGASAHE